MLLRTEPPLSLRFVNGLSALLRETPREHVHVHKDSNLELVPQPHSQADMFVQLPFEIIDHIVGYLDIKDVRPIARVCSTFRLPAQLQLFRTIRLVSSPYKPYPDRVESILSTPHLLQYLSHLEVLCYSTHETSFHSLLPRLSIMYRLSSMKIYLYLDDCSRALSALESLGSEKQIALNLGRTLDPNLLISDNPLPVYSLHLHVGAPNHRVVIRLVRKCAQSLRQLTLILKDSTIPPLPSLPHLCECSLQYSSRNDLDLMSWFPFLNQHPTITRISLGGFTLAVQPSPNLLPNLQLLEATPQIIERLIPGRPVNHIRALYHSQAADRFPDDIMLQPLRQPFVSVTTLAIFTNIHFPNGLLISIDQAVPKLRKFILRWTCYEVRQLS